MSEMAPGLRIYKGSSKLMIQLMGARHTVPIIGILGWLGQASRPQKKRPLAPLDAGVLMCPPATRHWPSRQDLGRGGLLNS